MHQSTCSAEGVETNPAGAGPAVFICVFHLIAGVVVALFAFGALAIFAR